MINFPFTVRDIRIDAYRSERPLVARQSPRGRTDPRTTWLSNPWKPRSSRTAREWAPASSSGSASGSWASDRGKGNGQPPFPLAAKGQLWLRIEAPKERRNEGTGPLTDEEEPLGPIYIHTTEQCRGSAVCFSPFGRTIAAAPFLRLGSKQQQQQQQDRQRASVACSTVGYYSALLLWSALL